MPKDCPGDNPTLHSFAGATKLFHRHQPDRDIGEHHQRGDQHQQRPAAVALAKGIGRAERGVALCGSGIGISISVNRNAAARCALVSEPLSAKLSREHNDANVIAMGARLTGIDMAKACLDAFLTTDFAGDRHARRVDKLSNPPQLETSR